MVFEMESCGACRTCELMCCFHHTGAFGSSPTSLRVLENPEGKGYLIVLAERDGDGLVSCDGCGGVKTPLCVEVCKEEGILLEYIRVVAKKKECG